MASPDEPNRGSETGTHGRGLELRPFRGLRFDADRVGDPGTVVSPPYDVLDAELVRDLEAANPRNIVRLILSRRFEAPYRAVLQRLDEWRAEGTLRPDPLPALYLYEYAVGATTVRGLVGLLGLRSQEQRVVLAHEAVTPEPVEDRMVLMRTTATNLEPILLVHEGTAGLRRLVGEAAMAAPVMDFHALDASRHRLWMVSDPVALAGIAGELAPGQALIADGHHRYAAYLGLREESRRLQAEVPSPWDYGLAMLVDQSDHPLAVGPIHRTVTGLTLAELAAPGRETTERLVAVGSREQALDLRALKAAEHRMTSFVVTDGVTWAVLSTPRTHEVDAGVLHESLLPRWGVGEARVEYHHSLDQAVRAVAHRPAVAIAVEPPSLAAVLNSARLGVHLPRKSTSFAPKPRMGVVMRDLRDG